VFDVEDELVAIATILTMVQKKQTVFSEMTTEKISEALSKLDDNSKPKWGNLKPQQMIEHLEYTYRIAAGQIQDFEIVTPEKYIEKVQATLYNYEPMPREYDFPLSEKSEMKTFKHSDLDTSKKMMIEAREEYLQFFKENPDVLTKNAVFGVLNKFECYLLERKHLNHHFSQFGLI